MHDDRGRHIEHGEVIRDAEIGRSLSDVVMVACETEFR